MGELKGADIISVRDLKKKNILQILELADALEPYARGEKQTDTLNGKVLANLFFEASTRTRLSFGTAFLRLGGAVETTVGVAFSSLAKGETLEDTIRVIDDYADIIVLRHPELGSAARAANVANKPVINGGDGPGEHPSQSLLDLYTIKKERGKIEETTVAFVGDLKHGRTVHSLTELLTNFEGITLVLASPPELQLPKDLLHRLEKTGLPVIVTDNLEEATKLADVMYVTRIQEERFEDPTEAAKYIGEFVVDMDLLEHAKPDITILHPLPRHGDLSENVDNHPGAAYFRQAYNGIPVRMALFVLLFGLESNFL